ncbi:cobalt transporter [Komagataeibacter nataicola]|uniref:Cobalt transporter n=5 Tax=Komagataeibacter TaxID=1434011 RepID=A0A9N7CXL9_9PROT|nr:MULTISPECIES: TolC family protein [Komagataeibacter]AHI27549.1 cobalt/zinc/cadmium resistance heavy metal efflux pump protein [Komagataeibacter xylinus E25]RFP00580.1 cobalt transporter [Komagataeibacter xylinus]AQU87091.1 cobalt transporter [Komagataeibacter nataicola]KPH85830.1 cobalt/zinc/cadmium resistance heavy metal efflux pump protein [Komagataeibacter intermedius AF2]MBV1825194.1 TolC family protein [Komagataeibacter oboediens]
MNRAIPPIPPIVSIAMACALPWMALAQDARPGPSFHEAVGMAWAIDPVRTELQVGHHSARARASAAGSWFAGGPTLSGEYMDDHMLGSNEGYTTYQGGVSVPLWLPGQGSATKQVASAEAASIDEQLNVEHMALSIRVLDAAAAALIARTRMDVAHALYDATARMAGNATHAVHGGELASVDGQMAQAAMENARNELALAQEEAQNATTALEVLLGRPVVPDLSRYGGGDVTQARFVSPRDMEDNDPRIKVAHRNVEAAEANMKLARRSFMPNPEIGVDAIHEKQYGSPWDDRVGVNFSIPLPSEVRNTPIMSEARNRLATATSQETQARRMVHLEMMRVRERLIAATTARQATRSAAENMEKRAQAQERAWQVGEAGVDTALAARQAAANTRLASVRAEVEWHVASIRMLIATGVVP